MVSYQTSAYQTKQKKSIMNRWDFPLATSTAMTPSEQMYAYKKKKQKKTIMNIKRLRDCTLVTSTAVNQCLIINRNQLCHFPLANLYSSDPKWPNVCLSNKTKENYYEQKTQAYFVLF